MTVKEAMNKIANARGYSELLDQLADEERDEHIHDIYIGASNMLNEYASVLEAMKIHEE